MSIKDRLIESDITVEQAGPIIRVTLSDGLDSTDYYFLSTPSISKKIYLGSISHSWEDGTHPVEASQMVDLINAGGVLPESTGTKRLNVESLDGEMALFLLSMINK